MATAGFIIMFMKSASKPPNPEAMKQLIAHFNANGGEVVFAGPVLKAYELGVGCPPMAGIVKFESKEKATSVFTSDEYQALLTSVEIGTTYLRDVRIVEAPADTFIPGKAYWVAQIQNVIKKEAFDKYFAALGAATEKGFEIAMDDGSTAKAKLAVKAVAPSNFFEEAKKTVPVAGEGAEFFPGTNTEGGLVVIAELGDHEMGSKLKECTDYKNALSAALDTTFTTDEAFEATQKEFTETVLRRDVRIIGVPAAA